MSTQLKISLVVAVDEAHGIGKNNELLCHLPADLQHFKRLTMGKPLIMGRKTYESIGRPLPGRRNIVLSRSSFSYPGVEVVSSLEQALALIASTSSAQEVMIIGGAQVYKQALGCAHQIYLTRIHHQFDADTFFPEIDPDQWQAELMAEHPKDVAHAYAMSFYCYLRR